MSTTEKQRKDELDGLKLLAESNRKLLDAMITNADTLITLLRLESGESPPKKETTTMRVVR